MKIWIYLNGIQQGPYSLDELADMPVKASTPVWYEGLPQWLPAGEAPATASLFGAEQSPQSSHTEAPRPEPAATPAFEARTVQAAAQSQLPPCPPTFIVWGIFLLICCCVPGGIIAIIFSALTSSAYSRGNYDRARRMSEYAEWTVIISIVLGLVSIPFGWMLWL